MERQWKSEHIHESYFERNASHHAGHQEQGHSNLLGTGHLLENEIIQLR